MRTATKTERDSAALKPIIEPSSLSLFIESWRRPYPFSFRLLSLIVLAPLYLIISDLIIGKTMHVPEIFFDRLIPLQAGWVFVYGPLYLFLIVLPILVVRQREHLKNTISAYLMIWLVSFVCFILYPTIAPRPEKLVGEGFAIWGVSFLYSSDPPYNCLPSIHVAHSFVSALTCYRVNKKVGLMVFVSAALVAVSTLFLKQHYIIDVLAGIGLAYTAYFIFLRKTVDKCWTDHDRQVAPFMALTAAGFVFLMLTAYWMAYYFNWSIISI